MIEEPIGPAPNEGTVADYKLLKKIGSGGYGDVWLARGVTGSLRAVKLLYRQAFREDGPFFREVNGIKRFEPISRQHPAFMEILHVGPNPPVDYFYYVMELADDRLKGRDIDIQTYEPKTLCSSVLSPAECLRVALDLADGLKKLHELGLCHRDIKPSNVIFVQGRPKFADIGLVGVLGEAVTYVGTQGFIPPEGPGSPQADIYSLGKLLYQVLTGRHVSDYPNLPEDLEKIPDKKLFQELNDVIIKACSFNPANRYKSATDLHRELILLSHGDSIIRLRTLEKRWKSVRQIGAVAALAGILGGAIWHYFNVKNDFARELAQRKAGYQTARAIALMNSGDYFSAFRTLAESFSNSENDKQPLEQRIRLASLLQKSPQLLNVTETGQRVNSLEFSSDGKHLLAGEYYGQVHLFSLSNFSQTKIEVPNTNNIESAALSPDGRWILMGGMDNPLELVSTASEETRILSNPLGYVCSVLFHPNGKNFLTSHGEGMVGIWNLSTGELERTLKGHSNYVNQISLSPNAALIATACYDTMVKVWNFQTGEEIQLMKHSRSVYHAAFNAASTRLITSCLDRKARVWDLATGKLIAELPHKDAVRMSLFAPDNSFLCTASWDGTIKFWDPTTLLPLRYNVVLNLENRVNAIAISPDSRQLASATSAGSIRLWSLEPQVTPFSLVKVYGPSEEAAHQIERWKKQTRQSEEINVTSTNIVSSLDGNVIAAAEDRRVHVWMPKGQKITVNHGGPIMATALNSNGTLLAVAEGLKLFLWDTRSGKLKFPSKLFSMRPRRIEFLNDRYLAACPRDSRINAAAAIVLDTETWKEVFRLPHNDGVYSAAMKGDRIVTCSEDYSAQLWDATTGQRSAPALLHDDHVYDAQFDDSGRMVITACADGSVRLWDARNGEPLSIPYKLPDEVFSVHFDYRGITARTATAKYWIPLPDLDISADKLERMGRLLSPTIQDNITPGEISALWRSINVDKPAVLAGR